MTEKLSYVLEPPILAVGLLGMYFGFSIDACVDIGNRLLEWWERIAVHLWEPKLREICLSKNCAVHCAQVHFLYAFILGLRLRTYVW